MNTFHDVDGILGRVEHAHLKRTKQEFLETAKATRVQLGRQAYYLDKYLHDLLNAISRTSAFQAADAGFLDAGELRRLYVEISVGNDQIEEHPLNEQIRSYIADHPQRYQERATKSAVYFCALAEDFLEYAATEYHHQAKRKVQERLDIVDLRYLYRKICASLGGEDQMEKLNLLIRQRFMVTTIMSDYVQGLYNPLLHTLTYRDPETSKTIHQFVLDDIQYITRRGAKGRERLVFCS